MREEENLIKLWEDLHVRAEVSFKEVRTTDYLIAYFKESGLNPVRFESIPGFYVDIGKGKPFIGLRADMDALMQEVNGTVQANHSCGHDAHMTIVTGVMLRLQAVSDTLKGTVRAIFQPAEELGNGSEDVIATGAADDLDYLFGVHLRPESELKFPSCAPGIQHGACAFIEGEIRSADHHGARPNEGVSAITVGSTLVKHLAEVHTAPFTQASAKLTKFQAGSDNLNIIPGNASFGIDLRAGENELMTEIKTRVNQIINSLSDFYGVEVNYHYLDEVPAAVINEEAEAILQKALVGVLGEAQTTERIQTTGSDDFHFYTLHRPHIKATMLALGADVSPGLHHPNMTFNKKAIINGVNILEKACLNIIGEEEAAHGKESK